MLRLIDDFLNKITMYRLVLYGLIFILAGAFLISFLGMIPYSPIALLFSTVFILILCWISNKIFSYAFNAPANKESFYITALILILLIAPPRDTNYTSFLTFATWASVLAIASKFIITIGKKHIFNPVAFAVVVTAFTINRYADGWIGTLAMLPFVLVAGLLIVRKVQRFDLVLSFLITALIIISVFSLQNGLNPLISIQKSLINSPILFFSFIMLTEPATTPPGRKKRIIYGTLTGLLFAPQVHLFGIYSTPELALVISNIYSYLISPKQKLVLTLISKNTITKGMYNFVFSQDKKMDFKPGQYLEWTLAHKKPDSRGNRRYFTIASSPTERDLIIGIKFYEKPSSFKSTLLSLEQGDKIIASQLSGDFVLPKDKQKKLAFIAGGIGVTPFRSMIKYLIDKNEKRSVVMLYSNKTKEEIAYKDIFDQAQDKLSLKIV